MQKLRMTWQELLASSYKNAISEALIIPLNNIADILKDEAYVYILEYEFGENIHENGKLVLPKYLSELEKISINKDLSYSHDPLGIVLENWVEVYVNERDEEDDQDLFCVPTNKINVGEFIGTFGASNFLTNTLELDSTEWSVTAGSRSLLLILPNLSAKGYRVNLHKALEIKLYANHELENIKYNSYKLIQNYAKSHKWKSVLLFFPKQWMDKQGPYFNFFRSEILGKAWKQSRHTRQSSIAYSLFRDLMREYNLIDYSDKDFVEPFMANLKSILIGKHMVLKPVDLKRNNVFTEFEASLNQKFSKDRKLQKFQVKLFEYEYLEKKPKDWGILSFSAPQLLGHTQSRLTLLRRDMKVKKDIVEFLLQKYMEECFESRVANNYGIFIRDNYNYQDPKENIIKKLTNDKIQYANYKNFNSYIIFHSYDIRKK